MESEKRFARVPLFARLLYPREGDRREPRFDAATEQRVQALLFDSALRPTDYESAAQNTAPITFTKALLHDQQELRGFGLSRMNGLPQAVFLQPFVCPGLHECTGMGPRTDLHTILKSRIPTYGAFRIALAGRTIRPLPASTIVQTGVSGALGHLQNSGSARWPRTTDRLGNNQELYQLSYCGTPS